jgi:hypothetical protein
LMILLLVFLTSAGSAFWLTLGAFAALLVMHAAYWVLTHPVNNFWLKDLKLDHLSGGHSGLDCPARPLGVLTRCARWARLGQPGSARRGGYSMNDQSQAEPRVARPARTAKGGERRWRRSKPGLLASPHLDRDLAKERRMSLQRGHRAVLPLHARRCSG